jgi:hypothetical protein
MSSHIQHRPVTRSQSAKDCLYLTEFSFRHIYTDAPSDRNCVYKRIDEVLARHHDGQIMDRRDTGSSRSSGTSEFNVMYHSSLGVLSTSPLSDACKQELLDTDAFPGAGVPLPEIKLLTARAFQARSLHWNLHVILPNLASCMHQVPFSGTGDFRGQVHSTEKAIRDYAPDKMYLVGSSDSWNYKSDAAQQHMRTLTPHPVRTAELLMDNVGSVWCFGFGW